jgi:hypothetical protein
LKEIGIVSINEENAADELGEWGSGAKMEADEGIIYLKLFAIKLYSNSDVEGLAIMSFHTATRPAK